MSHFVDPSSLDLMSRVTRTNSKRQLRERPSQEEPSPQCYTNTASPPTYVIVSELETGMNRLAPVAEIETTKPPVDTTARISLTDPRWAGLIVHSLVMGALPAVLQLSVYPFLTAYLNMEGTQTLSARTLLAIPWCIRPLFRILMDGLPLLPGHHHRLYMMLGWLIASASLVSSYFVDIPAPFHSDYTLYPVPLDNLTAQQYAALNLDAPAAGAKYIMFMAMATVGYVIADVAADVLIEMIATKYFPSLNPGEESAFTTRLTMFRSGAMLFSFVFMGVGLNGWDYGGNFDDTLTFNQVMLIAGIAASVPIPFAWLMIEKLPYERQAISAAFQRLWGLLQNGSVANIIACRFIGGVLGSISATPVNPITLFWIGLQPFWDNIFNVFAILVIIGLLMFAEWMGWTINYRLLIIGSNLAIVLLDCGATLITIWNIARSQWIWIGLPIVEDLPSGLDYVILTYILGEIAEPGSEELMRSLIMAVSFLATAFSHTLTKYIDGLFDVSNDNIAQDTTEVRVHTTFVFMVAYICQIISLMWLFTLPRNQEEARAWNIKAEPSPRTATIVVGVLTFSLVWCIGINVLSVIDSTSCLAIVGGKGCFDF